CGSCAQSLPPAMRRSMIRHYGDSMMIATQALTRRFGDLTAVDALTLAVAPGEGFGLLGPNRAGKSTAIKMLTTLLPPTSGDASVAGYDITRRAAEVRRSIGYVPQILSADGTLTGYENLLVFAKLYDLPRAKRSSEVRAALAFMGLSDAADKLVRTYSGGMIRRLEIAPALLQHPRVLSLDEPRVAVAPLARRAVWDLVVQLRADYGMTILLTTHLMEEADPLCDRVAIMDHGRVAAIGSPSDLKATLDNANATLDDVFVYYTGGSLGSGGSYRETARTRRTARRLG